MSPVMRVLVLPLARCAGVRGAQRKVDARFAQPTARSQHGDVTGDDGNVVPTGRCTQD